MRKNILIIVIGIVSLVVFGEDVSAATITASSCEYIDVQAAIDSAADGDTVVVPAGERVWTTDDINMELPGTAGTGAGSCVLHCPTNS